MSTRPTRGLPMSDKSFSHCFVVPLHDVDGAGVVFYAHLFRHAHDAYERFMAAIGFPLHRMIWDGSMLLPLVHAEADYLLPLRHGDAVETRLCVTEVGTSSFAVGYRFVAENGEVRALVRTVHAHVDRDRASPAPLSEALRAALSARLCCGEGRVASGGVRSTDR